MTTVPPRRPPPSRPTARALVRAVATCVLPLLLVGCPEPGAEARVINDRDTMTQRQRDSVTSTLPLPGARGVGGALGAVEGANARAARHDSIAGGRRE